MEINMGLIAGDQGKLPKHQKNALWRYDHAQGKKKAYLSADASTEHQMPS